MPDKKQVPTASPKTVLFRSLGALDFHRPPLEAPANGVGVWWDFSSEEGSRELSSKFYTAVSEITFILFYALILDLGFLIGFIFELLTFFFYRPLSHEF